MHELGIMNRVLALALRTAEENNATEIKQICLEVGVLSGILPDYLESFFKMITLLNNTGINTAIINEIITITYCFNAF